jgi:hypothetical protein
VSASIVLGQDCTGSELNKNLKNVLDKNLVLSYPTVVNE